MNSHHGEELRRGLDVPLDEKEVLDLSRNK
jgi:hypothetical protein